MESSVEVKRPTYELAFLLKEGEPEAIITDILGQFGAEIVQKGPIHQIQLAYPIKKNQSAQFGFYHLHINDISNLTKISGMLELKEGIIRFLLVKVPKKPKLAPRERSDKRLPTVERKSASPITATRLDSLSNEKLEETLEEILK